MKRWHISWGGLTTQLFLRVILPLTVLIIVVAFGGLHLHQQAMRTLVAERDERSVRAAAGAFSEQLSHRFTSVRMLAGRLGEVGGTEGWNRVLEETDFLLNDFDYGLAVFSQDEEMLATRGKSAFWDELINSGDSGWKSTLFQESPYPFFTTLEVANYPPVMLAVASDPESGLWASGAFSPEKLALSVLSGVFSPGERAIAFLVDGKGRLLYQVGDLSLEESPANHVGVQEALDGTSGATYLAVEGSEHVIAYSPITSVGWALVIEEPWEAVASPLLRTTENAPLVMVPALVLALVAIWFGVRQIVQPLKALETRAADLGWGDFEAIEEPVGGIAEIRRLQTELIHLAHKVKAAQQGLRGYIGAMTTGQEEERRRLARELHDDTLQALIALNQRVQLTQLSLEGTGVSQALAEIQELTTQTIRNLRRITRALRPIYLEDLGLVASLEMLSRETQAATGLQVVFQTTGPQRRFKPQDELALYRIAQEALSNAVRHAEAEACWVELAFYSPSVALRIKDNGKGFGMPESPAELAYQGHYGLLGMQERAELIGAKLEIQSQPGEGTRIEVLL